MTWWQLTLIIVCSVLTGGAIVLFWIWYFLKDWQLWG